jgi:hypothetical protein
VRTRLQMTPGELQWGRQNMIRDAEDLARWLWAESTEKEDLDAALAGRYNAGVSVKPAAVPRAEVWEIRFLAAPGGWLTTGQRLKPDPTERVRGGALPVSVRMAVPINNEGIVPRSLAPRRADLPRIAPGRWRYVGARSRNVPTLTLQVSAPRHGMAFRGSGVPGGPLLIRFPVGKTKLGMALKRLADEAGMIHQRREEGTGYEAWRRELARRTEERQRQRLLRPQQP